MKIYLGPTKKNYFSTWTRGACLVGGGDRLVELR